MTLLEDILDLKHNIGGLFFSTERIWTGFFQALLVVSEIMLFSSKTTRYSKRRLVLQHDMKAAQTTGRT